LSSRFAFVVISFLLAAAATPATTAGITVQEIQIGMPDGVKLAADLYLPDDHKAGQRIPVLLEYLAYRKTESRARNHRLYS
jgi:predicted acyl esterase